MINISICDDCEEDALRIKRIIEKQYQNYQSLHHANQTAVYRYVFRCFSGIEQSGKKAGLSFIG